MPKELAPGCPSRTRGTEKPGKPGKPEKTATCGRSIGCPAVMLLPSAGSSHFFSVSHRLIAGCCPANGSEADDKSKVRNRASRPKPFSPQSDGARVLFCSLPLRGEESSRLVRAANTHAAWHFECLTVCLPALLPHAGPSSIRASLSRVAKRQCRISPLLSYLRTVARAATAGRCACNP